MIKIAVMILCVAFSLSGCAKVGEFGNSLKYAVQGEYYLQNQNYKKGTETFKQAVKTDQKSSEANFYYGRFLLAEGKGHKALPYLKQAIVLAPDKSDYHFWLGVAYGESRQESMERKSYQMALKLDPKHVKALTYMGNNRLRAKKYEEALKYYSRALEISDENPQALFNRTIILKHLGRVSEEKTALLVYLDAYPSGSFARLAADRLNSLGDQSYRNHKLGLRTLTLTKITFVPFSDKLSDESFPSLDLVGSTVANMPAGKLNIIVYQLNNSSLAKRRALSIGEYLTKHYPDLQKNNRLQISWFGNAEKKVILKKNMLFKESVQFFLTDFKKNK